AGFPSMAVAWCLQDAGITLGQVAHVAVNSDPKANFGKKLAYAVTRRPDPRLVLDRIRNQSRRQSVEHELAQAFPGQAFAGKVHRIEHHLAHMGSCFLVSPFNEATVVSIDGFGDFSSAAWGIGRGNAIDIEGRVLFPHSLGVFYQALTQYLGFPHYGDEYKVMGLAPYGQPSRLAEMRQIVKLKDGGGFELDTRFFRHHRERIAYEWEGGSPSVGTLFSSDLEALLGPARGKDGGLEQSHFDLARSVQAMYEEAFFHLLDHLQARHGLEAVTLAGGCAMNSVANGKIMRRTPYRRVYVQSAAGDAGGAIGSAMVVWQREGRATPSGGTIDALQQHTHASGRRGVLDGDAPAGRFVMDHAYLGPHYTDEDVQRLLSLRAAEIARLGCRIETVDDEDALFRRTARAVARGDVVGWFQGRMEWGPRALGNRSIVCDPRRADMKDILNRKIKRRESFRPFAPSVLETHVSDWFEENGDVPFMMQVYQIRSERRSAIPAVTHVDGSGRLQTVYRATNPRYWGLIEAFRQETNVPIVLNTSFNENEPVVCTPAEALDCFLRTRMDLLVLGTVMITREDA
ncbi:MAG: hypothetical protein O9972_48725, partial [Burkholderiales bacterium]|nr:hypothetical protein [Burkholderiales bacterium]